MARKFSQKVDFDGFAGRQGRRAKRQKMGNCSQAPKRVPRWSIWVGFAKGPGQPRKSKFLCRLAGWLAGGLAGRRAAWHLRLLYVFQMDVEHLRLLYVFHMDVEHLRLLYVFQMDRCAFALIIHVPNEFLMSETNIRLL